MQHKVGTKLVLGVLLSLILVADAIVCYENLIKHKGQSFDYYVVWFGAVELWHGNNPYTENVVRQIQVGLLGHPAAPGEDQHSFSYPAYFGFLLLPFALLPFPWSVTVWLVLEQVFVFLALGLTLRALAWTPTLPVLLGLACVWILFRYTLIAFVLGQTSLLVLLCLSAAGYASSRGKEAFAALALALATIKPQLVIFAIAGWLCLMLFRRQWRAMAVFLGATVVLVLLPWMLMGNWVPGFWDQVKQYWGYTNAQSPLTLLLSTFPKAVQPAILVTGLIATASCLLWVVWRERDPNQRTGLVRVLAISILLTVIVIPLASVYDISLVLLPGLVCWRALSLVSGWVARGVQTIVTFLPILSWAIIMGLPMQLESAVVNIDVVLADKVMVPMLLLLAWIYTEWKAIGHYSPQRSFGLNGEHV